MTSARKAMQSSIYDEFYLGRWSSHSLVTGVVSLSNFFAINKETVASPVTFITVLNMSKGLSTAKMRDKPIVILEMGNPKDSRTITSMIKPAPGTAADPIEANVAVNMIVN